MIESPLADEKSLLSTELEHMLSRAKLPTLLKADFARGDFEPQ